MTGNMKKNLNESEFFYLWFSDVFRGIKKKHWEERAKTLTEQKI